MCRLRLRRSNVLFRYVQPLQGFNVRGLAAQRARYPRLRGVGGGHQHGDRSAPLRYVEPLQGFNVVRAGLRRAEPAVEGFGVAAVEGAEGHLCLEPKEPLAAAGDHELEAAVVVGTWWLGFQRVEREVTVGP